MSDNQKIDPALLGDESPAGLNPDDAVNGGLELKNKPRGIKKINKKGLIAGAALIGVAAIVATTTFNQAGGGASDAAKSAVANQGKTNGRPGELKRDALWYANQPDKVAAADKAPADDLADVPPRFGAAAPAQAGASAPDAAAAAGAAGQGVPDLTGKAISPLAAATAPKTGAPTLGGKPGQAGAAGAAGAAAGQPNQAEQQAQQQAQQAAQRKQQELDQAMKAGLSAQGFGAATQVAQAGTPGNNGMAGSAGVMPASFAPPQPQQEDPNKQDRKDQFAKAAKNGVDPDYSPSQKTKPRSPYEVKAGAIIPAVMIGGINSDLPGQVIAQVRENVYDSKSGQFLLIPQGSRLVGLYDAHVAYGQKRILLAWSRIIYPDGSSFDLKGMPGADKGGYAGFFDEVDNHYMKIFGSAVLMSFISAGVQLSQPNNGSSSGSNNTPSVSQTVGAALGQQIGQTAMTITQKNLNIQPTLEVRPGYQFNVMVTADMILPPAR